MADIEIPATGDTPQQITLQIDHSLLDYFRDGMQHNRIEGAPLEELALFLAAILNDTSYPIEAHRLEPEVIKLSHQPRAFADPIF